MTHDEFQAENAARLALLKKGRGNLTDAELDDLNEHQRKVDEYLDARFDRAPKTISHVAGVCIRVGDFAIQRCSICGAVLIDNRNQASPEGQGPTPSWECGRLVRVDVGFPTSHVLLPDAETLPPDSCLALI